ncbi:MAG: response regulator transcription factor [Gemmatimonadetes bacterium]|nr:response regulator transcription factor [Gemmatimonadota bacterium]
MATQTRVLISDAGQDSEMPAVLAGGPRVRARNLSGRERQVLRFLAQGYTNREIADRITVSVKTVETYRTRLKDKLGLRSRAQLFRFAVDAGLLRVEVAEPEDEQPERVAAG